MATADPQDDTPIATPFPARSCAKTTSILGIPTTATAMHFSDKILITLSQNGRLAHWIHVPLTPPQTSTSALYATLPTDPSTALLPSTDLTATTILGGTVPALHTLGETLATHLASAITLNDKEERRLLVLGLGLDRKMEGVGAGEFAELVGVGLDVL